MMTPNSSLYVLRLIVIAGTSSSVPIPRFTKKWELLRADWDSKDGFAKMTAMTEAAFRYARSLHKAHVRWIEVNWSWTK